MKKIELKPYFEVKPWGGNKLTEIFNAPSSSGEAWLVSAIKNKESKLENGEDLSLYTKENFKELGLKENEEFPVLIKIIDAKEDLSIQVHPDDEYAKSKGFNNGKYECWYILPETTNNKIIFGIKENTSKEILKKAIEGGTLENYLIYKDITAKDYLKVIPGTVHAILRNTFILEVQDPCDITYRLYDYNRIPKRELHIDDSLNVIYKNKYPVDLKKYTVQDNEKTFVINIKGYERFYIEIEKETYKTYLVIK